MSKNNYKVYVHINKVNGKRYYGITKQEVEKRWANGYGYQEQYFFNDIVAYGWNNFEHIVIAKGLTEEEAKWLEVELIREHDTTNPKYGYNQSLGGNHSHSEETRKKMSESHKGKNNPKATKVYCVELDMTFDTITEASKFVGYSFSTISRVLDKSNKTCGGYHWLRAEDVEIENSKVS